MPFDQAGNHRLCRRHLCNAIVPVVTTLDVGIRRQWLRVRRPTSFRLVDLEAHTTAASTAIWPYSLEPWFRRPWRSPARFQPLRQPPSPPPRPSHPSPPQLASDAVLSGRVGGMLPAAACIARPSWPRLFDVSPVCKVCDDSLPLLPGCRGRSRRVARLLLPHRCICCICLLLFERSQAQSAQSDPAGNSSS